MAAFSGVFAEMVGDADDGFCAPMLLVTCNPGALPCSSEGACCSCCCCCCSTRGDDVVLQFLLAGDGPPNSTAPLLVLLAGKEWRGGDSRAMEKAWVCGPTMGCH